MPVKRNSQDGLLRYRSFFQQVAPGGVDVLAGSEQGRVVAGLAFAIRVVVVGGHVNVVQSSWKNE